MDIIIFLYQNMQNNFNTTLLDTYSKAEIDDMVHGIYKAQDMSLDDYKSTT